MVLSEDRVEAMVALLLCIRPCEITFAPDAHAETLRAPILVRTSASAEHATGVALCRYLLYLNSRFRSLGACLTALQTA